MGSVVGWCFFVWVFVLGVGVGGVFLGERLFVFRVVKADMDSPFLWLRILLFIGGVELIRQPCAVEFEDFLTAFAVVDDIGEFW